MRTDDFERFLHSDPNYLTDKAIASRLARAKKAELLLKCDLDKVVLDDNSMYDALIYLGQNEDRTHSPMQNALRKYYKFTRGKDFPQLRNFTR